MKVLFLPGLELYRLSMQFVKLFKLHDFADQRVESWPLIANWIQPALIGVACETLYMPSFPSSKTPLH